MLYLGCWTWINRTPSINVDPVQCLHVPHASKFITVAKIEHVSISTVLARKNKIESVMLYIQPWYEKTSAGLLQKHRFLMHPFN
jgi:hypothetical protein